MHDIAYLSHTKVYCLIPCSTFIFCIRDRQTSIILEVPVIIKEGYLNIILPKEILIQANTGHGN